VSVKYVKASIISKPVVMEYGKPKSELTQTEFSIAIPTVLERMTSVVESGLMLFGITPLNPRFFGDAHTKDVSKSCMGIFWSNGSSFFESLQYAPSRGWEDYAGFIFFFAPEYLLRLLRRKMIATCH